MVKDPKKDRLGRTNHDPWLNSFNIAMKYMGERQGTALDIGCRDGDWAKHMCKRFDFTHGFDYRPRSSLKEVTDRKKFKYHQVALGESEYVVKAKAGTIVGDTYEGSKPTKLVKVVTLDSFNIENVVFAKLDVEGYESKVLMGAEETFRRDKPVICVEINDDERDAGFKDGQKVKDILESWGYVFQQVDDIEKWDYFFVHEDYL
jgi:FkbM family methyltransferase